MSKFFHDDANDRICLRWLKKFEGKGENVSISKAVFFNGH